MLVRRLAALVFVLTCAASALAQGGAGTRADQAGQAGWDAIRAGRNDAAAAAFAAALEANPRDPSLHLGAGVAAHLLGDTAKARASFEEALKLAPNFTTASVLLGDLLYGESDLEGAVTVYQSGLKYAPGDKTLEDRLARMRQEPSVENGFFQSRSAHFTVLFEGPADEDIARRALEVLENAYWRIGSALSTFPDSVITVVLYTEEQFRDTTRSPSWAAAAYDGRIRVPMRGALDQAAGELERVLSHELTHAMIRAIAPTGVPTWLNEGLAVVFEREGPPGDSTPATEPGARIPLGQLAGRFDGLSGDQARVAYAESADASRRLFDQVGGAGVVALLRDIARGVPLNEAFERRTLMSFSEFAAGFVATP